MHFRRHTLVARTLTNLELRSLKPLKTRNHSSTATSAGARIKTAEQNTSQSRRRLDAPGPELGVEGRMNIPKP